MDQPMSAFNMLLVCGILYIVRVYSMDSVYSQHSVNGN